MSEFNRNCERFLATTRQHFFTASPDGNFDQRDDDKECWGGSRCDILQRAHSGK